MSANRTGFDLDALRARVSGDPARVAGCVARALSLLDRGRSDEARAALAEILEPARQDDLRAEPASPAARGGVLGDDEIERAFAAAEPEVDEMISPNRMAERVLLDHAPLDDELLRATEDELHGAAGDELHGAAGDEFHGAAEDELHGAAGDLHSAEDDSLAADAFGAPPPLFRTATMADLLARQGDRQGAEAIRRELSRSDAAAGGRAARIDAAMAPDEPAPALARSSRSAARDGAMGARGEASRRGRILATLERWLENIHRGTA